MIKRILIFLITTILSIALSYGQNPYYTVTQENVAVLSTNAFGGIHNYKEYGNRFGARVIPAHTTFLIENNTVVNVTGSMHIQGIPIGFKFPYAGEEFDIYALNGKGYIVLGKSWEGGMTIYADTIIETATDTIFTNKNKFLVSALYTGKNLDHVSFLMFNKGLIWGFPGEKKTNVAFENYYYNNLNGTSFGLLSVIEFSETGEILIRNEIQTFNTNEITNTYATFLQRDGSSNTQSLAGTGADTDSWWNTVQAYSANDIKFGFLSTAVKPKIIYGDVISDPARIYTIRYKPINPVYRCPVPIVFNSNPPRIYSDSAYLSNDHQYLQGDTIETSDKVWWFSDMRDNLRFDVYLGTDETSMQLYKAGLVSDTFEVFSFSYVMGMVKLSLDSLAAAQKYVMRIHTIHPAGDTTVCDAVSFYTKPTETINNYCRNDEYLFSGFEALFEYTILDFNTLHFNPDEEEIQSLQYKNIVPDTGSWTTTVQQGQSYQLLLGTIETSTLVFAHHYIPAIYVDYNNDGDFEDAGEFYITQAKSPYRYQDVPVTIPLHAVPGKTRLRIMHRIFDITASYPGPCEIESTAFTDFIITIAQAPGCNLSYKDTIVSPSCAAYNNGELSINPEGGTAPYHIQWNTGDSRDTLFTLSGLASPSRHRATITDAAGCNIRTAMLQLTQPMPLHVDTMFHSSPAWIAFNGGTKPYQIDITGDKTETRYAVNDTIFLTDLPAGNYNIKAMDSNGCEEQYILSHTTDPDPLQPTGFILYPNPATQYIQIAGINNNAFIIIYSSDGKKVFEGNCTNQQIIQLPGLASALYLVRISEDERNKTIKLIIK